ncbi:hypothetical protein cce_2977 [Crocosphaera subtropica ATCC 51142]|uniref:DUF5666 domain-containing protein n=1 Tax=Crocosphaera subtropica (strain ATCC 51142 / BH68) TaxID=43989 RepID=B1WVZ2_CROS5|nr:hypothetical protein [Crocosphaera subtropica]ACB52325.1 hypothetical protein cce_2977 [Crocosphaera subtropica ATCC 51142]
MKLKIASLGFFGILLLTTGVSLGQNQGTSFSGRIQKVWEDGFKLQTNNRTLTVDTWDVCGDYTAKHLAVGDQVTIIGEFEMREFDAFSITKVDGTRGCQAASNYQ